MPFEQLCKWQGHKGSRLGCWPHASYMAPEQLG